MIENYLTSRYSSGFVASLDKACGKFINANAVTRAANSSSKSPELLARYCDLLLKKSSKNPEEVNVIFALGMVRFNSNHLSLSPVPRNLFRFSAPMNHDFNFTLG